MPKWLRQYVFNEIKAYYEELDNAQSKKDNEIDLANPDKTKIPGYANPKNKPKVSPKVANKSTYITTKAPKR